MPDDLKALTKLLNQIRRIHQKPRESIGERKAKVCAVVDKLRSISADALRQRQ